MTRPRQKDSLDKLLANFEFARIKEYVDRRSREAARAQVTAVTRDDTVQHCSPCSPNPDRPSGAYFNLENNEGEMGPELEELESPSAGAGLETPGQQCPPYEGIWEQGRTTASGFSTAGVGSSKKRNISSSTERATSTVTVAGISSNAATPSKRMHKTSSEENKQFDPGRRKEKAPPWDSAVTLPSFSGEKLGGFLSVFYLCFFYALCVPVFPKLFFLPGDTYQQAERHERIESLEYATGGKAFSRLLPF